MPVLTEIVKQNIEANVDASSWKRRHAGAHRLLGHALRIATRPRPAGRRPVTGPTRGTHPHAPPRSRPAPAVAGQPAPPAPHPAALAALMAISQSGEGCESQMARTLETIVKAIVAKIADAHPRVRWAAINTIGQMSTDFGPELQEKLHECLPPR